MHRDGCQVDCVGAVWSGEPPAAGDVQAGEKGIVARWSVGWDGECVYVGDVFTGQPAGGGTGPVGRDGVGLGDQLSLRVEQVQEDVVGGAGLRLGAPDEGDGDWVTG